MKLDQTIDIGTDGASFFLFHPDDLAHRKDDPLDWFTYGFACRKEFEAGNLVAFLTGADGGYQLRLTSGDLTDKEKALETGSWEWGYTVRYGKLLVDNGDHLPSEEAFDVKKAPNDQWVALPNGDYRVTVHPIEREDNSLPDYVIRFEQVDNPLHIAKSSSLPDLIPLRDNPQKAYEGASADDVFDEGKRANGKPLAEIYPLLIATEQYILPGGSLSVAVTDELFDAVRREDDSLTTDGDIYVVAMPNEDMPGLGTLAWVNGSSQITGKAGRLSLRGERLVRVIDRKEGKLLPTARVEAITRKKSSLDETQFKELQTAFLKYADTYTGGKNGIPAFERERVEAMTSGSALTTRMIELLPLPVELRFQLQGASDAERAEELMKQLEAA